MVHSTESFYLLLPYFLTSLLPATDSMAGTVFLEFLISKEIVVFVRGSIWLQQLKPILENSLSIFILVHQVFGIA